MNENMSLKTGLVLAAGVVGLSLVVSAIVGATASYNVRSSFAIR